MFHHLDCAVKSCEKFECRTPTPGKKSTNIPLWKYTIIEKAIFSIVSEGGNSGIFFKTLALDVEKKLNQHSYKDIGSISWLTTTVKLEMEVSKKIRRIKDKNGQKLILSDDIR